ncbi:MAG: response regulator [Proteobacteria bacterium]|nr:response regulator [Pseudomonadota bacterium]
MSSDEAFFQKLVSIYYIESKERIQEIANLLMSLEKTKDSEEQKNIIQVIFREIHSLKSASRSVNLPHIENIFKALEDVYSVFSKKELNPTREHLDILHKINDVLDRLISGSHDRDKVTQEEEKISHLFNQLQQLNLVGEEFSYKAVEKSAPKQHAESHKEEDTVRISSEKVNALLVNAEEMLTTRLSLLQIVTDLSSFKDEIEADLKRWDKFYREKNVLLNEEAHAQNKKNNDQELRKKFVDYIAWSEESIKQIELKLRDVTASLEHELHGFSHYVDNLLEDTKKLLLWPFSTILYVLPRIIRDLSHSMNKEINLVIEGAEVEIDKRILETMRDIILHLVRNAVDHGIEVPQERKRQGKPEMGRIKISAHQLSGNEIEITIADDGAGININEIKASALKQGMITKALADTMTNEQAINLIFNSGISSSKIITDLSGRGLGMAIIRDKLDQIGGEIALTSQAHKGTTFKIKLPLTLATFKGLLIEAVNQQFLIPTANIERILRIDQKDISTVENTETIAYEGKTLSLVWLSDLLGIKRNENNVHDNESLFLSVIIITSVDKKIAFVVDNILNEQEILVKNFSKPLIKVKNVSAAAIASSGRPIPILNCLDLLQCRVTKPHITASKEDPSLKNTKILLVEDSFTTRTLLKNILELGGYQVSAASDGLDAWNTLKTNDYAIVVSDVEMPRMNGFQLTQKIRNDKKLGNLPVILITSRESQDDKERGIDAGANAYLPKSTFDSGRLLEIIKRLQV